jgi:hypothetical protein
MDNNLNIKVMICSFSLISFFLNINEKLSDNHSSSSDFDSDDFPVFLLLIFSLMFHLRQPHIVHIAIERYAVFQFDLSGNNKKDKKKYDIPPFVSLFSHFALCFLDILSSLMVKKPSVYLPLSISDGSFSSLSNMLDLEKTSISFDLFSLILSFASSVFSANKLSTSFLSKIKKFLSLSNENEYVVKKDCFLEEELVDGEKNKNLIHSQFYTLCLLIWS